MFGRVGNIPIDNTFGEWVEMDFVDYGGYAAFLHTPDSFFAIFCSIACGGKEKGWANIGNGPYRGDFPMVSGVWGAWDYFGR